MDTSCKPSSSSSSSGGSALHYERGSLGLCTCVKLTWPSGGGNTATHARLPSGFKCISLPDVLISGLGLRCSLVKINGASHEALKNGQSRHPKASPDAWAPGGHLITPTCKSSSSRELVATLPLIPFLLMGLIPPGSGILAL